MEKRNKEYGALIASVAVPVAIAAVVWYVTLPILRYTLLMQEQRGLFLMTHDYFRQVFSDSWPLTTLISDFLVQFYRTASVGALITGTIVAMTYLSVCTIFRFTSLRKVFGGLAAAGTWLAIAHAPTPHMGVVILSFAVLAAVVSLCIQYAKIPVKGHAGLWQGAVAVALTVVTAVMIVKDEELNRNEKWYAVEYTSRVHDWNTLLAIATPQLCRSDMSYVPYALLALNAKGQLLDKWNSYPVDGPESLGELGEMNWSAYSLRSQIHEVCGSTNEAIHLCVQMGMALPHGTSLGTLRQLIRLEIENGDYALVRKHALILARSPLNRKYAASALEAAASAEKEASGDKGKIARSSDVMVSNNAVYNLGGIISNCRNATSAAKERLLCHLLLSGDMNSYNRLMKEFNQTN